MGRARFDLISRRLSSTEDFRHQGRVTVLRPRTSREEPMAPPAKDAVREGWQSHGVAGRVRND